MPIIKTRSVESKMNAADVKVAIMYDAEVTVKNLYYGGQGDAGLRYMRGFMQGLKTAGIIYECLVDTHEGFAGIGGTTVVIEFCMTGSSDIERYDITIK